MLGEIQKKQHPLPHSDLHSNEKAKTVKRTPGTRSPLNVNDTSTVLGTKSPIFLESLMPYQMTEDRNGTPLDIPSSTKPSVKSSALLPKVNVITRSDEESKHIKPFTIHERLYKQAKDLELKKV